MGGGGVDFLPIYMSPPGRRLEETKEPQEEVKEEKVPSEDKTWKDEDETSEVIRMSPGAEAEDSKDGRISYDRDFLLQFQFSPICTAKPEGLPDIEIVLNNINTRQPFKQPTYQNRVGGEGVDFMPSYMRPPGRGQNQSNTPRGSKAPPKKIVSMAIEQKVEETIRKFHCILNKLTPQKFQTLIPQVLDLEIDTPQLLEEIIDITFEKAIAEPSFGVVYANMCRCLLPEKCQNYTGWKGSSTDISQNPTEQVSKRI